MTEQMIGHAIALAADAFKNKTDKGGIPYIMHCLFVMNNTDGDDCVKCSAVLHDVIEDTHYTFHELEVMGFSKKTINILRYVTHDIDDTYEEYIKLIGTNLDAIKIKKADLRHNSCITRLKGISVKDFKRMEKYNKAYIYLTKCEELLKIL